MAAGSVISNWPVPGYVHTAIRQSTESNSAKVRMKPDGGSLQNCLLIPFVCILNHIYDLLAYLFWCSTTAAQLAPVEYTYTPIEWVSTIKVPATSNWKSAHNVSRYLHQLAWVSMSSLRPSMEFVRAWHKTSRITFVQTSPLSSLPSV